MKIFASSETVGFSRSEFYLEIRWPRITALKIGVCAVFQYKLLKETQKRFDSVFRASSHQLLGSKVDLIELSQVLVSFEQEKMGQ